LRRIRNLQINVAFCIATTIAASYEWDRENEFANHLRSAKAGCAMLRTQLSIADELGAVSSVRSDKLIKESLDISERLQTIIASAHDSDFEEMLGKNSNRI
jgi:four helix bundle protein